MLEDEFEGWQNKDSRPMSDEKYDKQQDLIAELRDLNSEDEFKQRWMALSAEQKDLVGIAEYEKLTTLHGSIKA